MASNYLGLNRGAGDNPGAIVAGAASGSTDMELRYDTGKGITKQDLMRFYELLEQYTAGNGLADGLTGSYLPPL